MQNINPVNPIKVKNSNFINLYLSAQNPSCYMLLFIAKSDIVVCNNTVCPVVCRADFKCFLYIFLRVFAFADYAFYKTVPSSRMS